MQAPLLSERAGDVRVLILNRPDRLNALDQDLRLRIVTAIAEADADETIRATVLFGAGRRAFCAGQDLNESAALGSADGPGWMAGWQAYFSVLARSVKPTIAAVNGVAAGAGFQTALLADLRIASLDARFVMAEVDVDLPAIVGHYLLTSHLGHSRAAELVLTGRSLSAEEAREAGLVRKLVPQPDLMDAAIDAARELAAKPAVALRLNLQRFHGLLAAELADAERAAAVYQSEAVASGQPQRAMRDFLAQRAARRASAAP